MAIRVTCPSCGAKRSLSDAFRGLNVTCPKCGNRFTAAESPSSGSSDAVTVGAESAASMVSQGSGRAEGYRTATVVSYPAPPAEPPAPEAQPETPTKLLLQPSPAPAPASAPAPAADPPAPAPAARCEYKVLVPLAQSTGFRPDQLEQILNDWARDGWRLKSTALIKLESPDGPRDDLIVILER